MGEENINMTRQQQRQVLSNYPELCTFLLSVCPFLLLPLFT